MKNEMMWELFPRSMEQKINGLLNEAEPTQIKSFQLYKACKNDNLWRNSYELFCVHLQDYFSQPLHERAKSYFDKFLDRPMDRQLYDHFQLTFRNSIIKPQAIKEVAAWSSQMIKHGCKINSVVASEEVMSKTLEEITSPPAHEKDHDIDFEDFCIMWKKTVFKLFGKKYDPEMNKILAEIRWLNKQIKQPEVVEPRTFRPSIYLTQTEIEWVEKVQNAVFDYGEVPKFPLARGPEKDKLHDLNRALMLYQVVLSTTRPELMQHRESVRNTILDQCAWLLKECAR